MLCVVDDMTRELEIDSVTETYTREGFLEEQMKLLKEIHNRNLRLCI